jgi:UPF0176 protein
MPMTPVQSDSQAFVVAALYQFVRLEDCDALQVSLTHLLKEHAVRGTLLLAHEGINGTVAGTRAGIEALKSFLKNDGRFDGLEYKESFSDAQPFLRTKVRLKKEIVTLGVEGIDPNIQKGAYVDARAWDALLADPDVVVLDVRNDYEVDMGTFKGALNPKTQTFRAFPQFVKENLDPQKNKKVAMVCTGGIRCEKASAYMMAQGFEEVYHLKGGILRYLETTSPQETSWEGECFVFDNRVSVDHNLSPGAYDLCHACRHPLSAQDQKSPLYQEGISCSFCAHEKERNRGRALERQKQMALAKERGQTHLGSL